MDTPDCTDPVGGPDSRNVLLSVFVATFDVYLRSVAEIAVETGLSRELTVETLMAYCLALAESDELITGFIRGDLTMVSLNEQTRQMVERDTRLLGLEAVGVRSASVATTTNGQERLGKKLEALKNVNAAGHTNEKASSLEAFVGENPAIFAQVKSASHEFLVRWVMYYLMRETKSRERGHVVAHEFWKNFPKIQEKVRASGAGRSIEKQAPSRMNVGRGIGAV